MFHTHDGPTDIDTMTKILQLRFQCDADLGGNLEMDTRRPHTSDIFASQLYVGAQRIKVVCLRQQQNQRSKLSTTP